MLSNNSIKKQYNNKQEEGSDIDINKISVSNAVLVHNICPEEERGLETGNPYIVDEEGVDANILADITPNRMHMFTKPNFIAEGDNWHYNLDVEKANKLAGEADIFYNYVDNEEAKFQGFLLRGDGGDGRDTGTLFNTNKSINNGIDGDDTRDMYTGKDGQEYTGYSGLSTSRSIEKVTNYARVHLENGRIYIIDARNFNDVQDIYSNGFADLTNGNYFSNNVGKEMNILNDVFNYNLVGAFDPFNSMKYYPNPNYRPLMPWM